MTPTKLENAVADVLHTHRLAEPGQRGLVCVSGGGDSMAALHLLAALAPRWRLELEVLHFDHGLRPESGREAEWVRERAVALGLGFHLRAAGHLAGLEGGVQAAARAWRAEQAAAVVRERGAAWAATGHQRDDQAETVLLKLLRGCHLTNLRGMEWRAGPFIRPLLGLQRAALRAWLRARGVDWLEDPSNRDFHYRRNRVRGELMPLLNDLAGGDFAARLEALDAQAREAADLLATFPQPPQNPPLHPPHWIEVAHLAALPPLVQAEALHRFVQARLPGQLSGGHVRQALALVAGGSQTWRLDLPGGRRLARAGARLFLEQPAAVAPAASPRNVGPWRVDAAPGLGVEGHTGSCGDGMAVGNLPAGERLALRHRQPGDRFHPAWRRNPVKLKDFLRDQHVPLHERGRLPLLVVGKQVVGIYPLFVARGFEPGAGQGFCFHVTRA